MLLDFGILKLKEGDQYVSPVGRERAWLLIKGTVTFIWEGEKETVTRNSCFDEAPYVLHVSKDAEVVIKTETECEICVEQVDNSNSFDAKLYTPDDIRFTVKDNALYAIVLGWPYREECKISTLRKSLLQVEDERETNFIHLITEEDIKYIKMLGVDKDLNWTLDDNGLSIEVPDKKPCDYAVTYKIKWN